jgi:hypothetical protein
MAEAVLSLRTTQRNIYRQLLVHQRKYGDKPCPIQIHTSYGAKARDYLNALNALERKQLVVIDRIGKHYTQWTMKCTKSIENNNQ